jgi:hypothetical protein
MSSYLYIQGNILSNFLQKWQIIVVSFPKIHNYWTGNIMIYKYSLDAFLILNLTSSILKRKKEVESLYSIFSETLVTIFQSFLQKYKIIKSKYTYKLLNSVTKNFISKLVPI